MGSELPHGTLPRYARQRPTGHDPLRKENTRVKSNGV